MGKVPAQVFALLCIAWLLLGISACSLSEPAQLGAPTAGGPLAITILAPVPEQAFVAGTLVIVQARIENAGADLARVAVLLDGSLLGEQLAPNPSAAHILPLTVDWRSSNPGRYTLTVLAERASGSSARSDVDIEVLAHAAARPVASPEPLAGGVNLQIRHIRLQPNPPACGHEAQVQVGVHNSGNTAAPNIGILGWALELAESGEVSADGMLPAAEGLAAGEDIQISFPLLLRSLQPLPQRLRVTVDIGNHVPESDETDNGQSSEPFFVSAGNCGGA